MAKLLHGSGEKAQSTFASLAMPVVVVSGGSIVWYNDAFSQDAVSYTHLDVYKRQVYYEYGDNKTEQAAKAYWQKVKG